MRGAVITGPLSVEFQEFPRSEPLAADAVRVSIVSCGVCATDVHAYQSGKPISPAVFGHEWVGVVAAAGDGVSGIGVGDRVVVGVGSPCGSCSWCEAGLTDRCQVVYEEMLGIAADSPTFGGFADEVEVSARRVIAIPDAVGDAEAAVIEPLSVAYHAVRRTPISLGDVVLVQGAGAIGLAVTEWCRLAGARVLVTEPDAARRAVAERLGGTAVAPGEEAAAALAELSSGRGADIVFECSGVASLVAGAAAMARRGGFLMLVGFPDDDSAVPTAQWLLAEITVGTCIGFTRDDVGHVLTYLAERRIRATEELVTGNIGLDDLVPTLGSLARGNKDHIKILVAIGGGR